MRSSDDGDTADYGETINGDASTTVSVDSPPPAYSHGRAPPQVVCMMCATQYVLWLRAGTTANTLVQDPSWGKGLDSTEFAVIPGRPPPYRLYPHHLYPAVPSN